PCRDRPGFECWFVVDCRARGKKPDRGPAGQIRVECRRCSVLHQEQPGIVAGGRFPHWPPETTRYLISTGIEVVNLATGAIEYQRQYPLGYLAGQGIPGVAPDWVLVSASPDGHYVAESGVFNARPRSANCHPEKLWEVSTAASAASRGMGHAWSSAVGTAAQTTKQNWSGGPTRS